MNEKIDIKPIYLPPFKRFCMTIGELPTSYVETMSYYEMLLWFTKYLGDTVIPAIDNNAEALKEVQDLFLQLQDYVNDYFDELNVQSEINNKLDDMVEDGTLAEIINQQIFDELNDKIDQAMFKTDNQSYSNLTLERKLRYFVQNTNHPSHISGQDQPLMQGGTYTGSNKMVIVKMNGDNNTVLQEISLNDGSVTRSASISLGHGNSVTYNPTSSKLYITGLTGDDKHKVFVINYTTFTLENTLIFDSLEVNEGTHSISYDIEKDKYYLMTETSPSNYLTLYEIDMSDSSLTEVVLPDYDNLLTTTNTNDMFVYDNIIYIMKYSPQVIVTYDVESKELQNVYNINNISSAKIPVGELENISIKYDTTFKNLLIGSSKIECENGFYHMYQFFEANPIYNISNNIVMNINGEHKTLHVDINSTAINPNGDNSNRFKHLAEALEYADNCNGKTDICVFAGEYPFTSFYDLNKVVTVYRNESDSITIDGLRLENCNNIYFTGFTFDNKSSSQTYDINLYRSYVKLSNCTMTLANNENCRIHNTRLNIFNVTNLIIYSQAENSIECLDTTPTYKIKSGNMPMINKPVKLFNGTATSSSASTTFDLSGNAVLKDCNTLYISLHGNYNYLDVSLPNIKYDGIRAFSTTLGNWIITLVITRSDNNYSINIDYSKAISGTDITDNTSTATLDYIVYAQD